MSKTGIVILNYNNANDVLTLVKKIVHYDCLAHIVIVDNASTDNSQQIIERFVVGIEKIDLCISEKNKGYAAGNNIGARFLIENYAVDYIFIANPDVEFGEEFAGIVVGSLKKNEEYAVLTGVMCDANNKVSAKPYFNIPTFKDDIVSCMILLRMLKKRKNLYKVDFTLPIMHVEAVQGSLFCIKANVLKQIGYLDENTFLFYEENILANKIVKAGYKEGIIPLVRYLHMHGSTIGKSLSILSAHKEYLKSKYYYEVTYNKIAYFKKAFLMFFCAYSFMETLMLLPFKKIVYYILNLIKQ